MNRDNLSVLVIGGGGREHALCRAIENSPLVGRVLCAPGNGGMEPSIRRPVTVSDYKGIVKLAHDENVDLVVIGPEAPLVEGLSDLLRESEIAVFGPSRAASVLEGSKVYTRSFCVAHRIPAPEYMVTGSISEARGIIREWGAPIVIKADGLCAGKGVVVADTAEVAVRAACRMLVERVHGDAGSRIVIEQFEPGNEFSLMFLCDGTRAIALPPARDFKRAENGDRGQNTGGMGAYSPPADVTPAIVEQVLGEIIHPTLDGMRAHNQPYHGLLYAGGMLTPDGVKLLEFNCRWGDPEAQVVLPRIQSDIVEYLFACAELGGLADLGPIDVNPAACVGTILASGGYPGKYRTGIPISVAGDIPDNALVFHSGTEMTDGQLLTSSGRVMCIVGRERSIPAAREVSLNTVGLFSFDGMSYRSDIALNA